MASAAAYPPWRVGPERLLTFEQPRLMAVLNLTPDSFSDGGELDTPNQALTRARASLAEGADVLDVGGESTRPGADHVPAEEQIRRVVPVVRLLREAGITALITVDTTLAPVAQAALDAGADGVNDVSGGREDPQLLPLVSERGAGIVLMHRLLPPDRDVYSDRYAQAPIVGDILAFVGEELARRRDAALAAGIAADSIVLDPGLGFGKTVAQNLALMGAASFLGELGRPVLFGHSRKSFLGAVSGESDPSGRDAISAAATALMCQAGARFFRVHNIAIHRQALALAEALESP